VARERAVVIYLEKAAHSGQPNSSFKWLRVGHKGRTAAAVEAAGVNRGALFAEQRTPPAAKHPGPRELQSREHQE